MKPYNTMETQQELDFGVTLDNDNLPPTSKRQLKGPSNTPKKSQNSTTSSSQSNTNLIGSANNYQISRANKPGVCFATIFFKLAAFFTYFFMSYMLSNVLTFIFTIVLGSLDFWVVKNVSGRLLVGLRWWSDYDENGNQIWKFETHNSNFEANVVDQSFFWTSQIIGTVVWALFLLINILQLDLFWALLIGINFSFCATNLYGYYMCRGEHKKKIGSMKEKIGQQLGRAGLMSLASKYI